MINPIDYIYDKTLYPAQGAGMLGGLAGMIIWLFPMNIFSGVLGFVLTIFTTCITTMSVLVITGIYKKHEAKILKFFEMKITKSIKDDKEKDNDKAA